MSVQSRGPLRSARRGAAHVSELQRSRLLGAAVGVVEEFGYAEASVARITARARVSRRTFYELFDNREECMVAVLDEAVELVATEIDATDFSGRSWREQVHLGMWTILSFLERERALARVCVVETNRGGPLVLARRAAIVARLAEFVDAGREESAKYTNCASVIAEGVVGAALAIVHGRLWREEPRPLTELQEALVGIVMLPYIGAAATRREQARPAPAPIVRIGSEANLAPPSSEPLVGAPMRLTYRTARVIQCVAEQPGLSNREVAERAEIHDQGQVSKLLTRLTNLELLTNSGGGHLTGEPNAWWLTPKGGQLAQSICGHIPAQRSQVGRR